MKQKFQNQNIKTEQLVYLIMTNWLGRKTLFLVSVKMRKNELS